MTRWLLDNPAGISVLTVIAASLVAAAAWAAFGLVVMAVLAVIKLAVRLTRHADPGDAPGM